MSDQEDGLQTLTDTVEAARELAEELGVPIPVAWSQPEYRAVMDAIHMGVGTGALRDSTETMAEQALRKIGVDKADLELIFGAEFDPDA